MSHPVFYFVAGEHSGDRHSARLWEAFKTLEPNAQAYGVGGAQLREAGQKQLFDLVEHAVVGLTDVLLNYFKFRKFFYQVLEDIEQKKPSALILVDYPGFNLRLAKQVKKRMPDLPVIYYISPQVWAWKAGRSRLMRKVIDLLLVIFSFEKDWFQKHEPKLNVEWVGHPLVDRWQSEVGVERPVFGNAQKIALLPGSRDKEIARHLPLLIETGKKIQSECPDLTLAFFAADEGIRERMEQEIQSSGLGNTEIHSGQTLTELSACDAALVASGTATLECAVAGVPMVVFYKAHPLTFWVGRRLVKLPYLGMVNVLAGRMAMPEFLQEQATSENLSTVILGLVQNPEYRRQLRDELKTITSQLGLAGASQRAAAAVQNWLALSERI